MPYGDFGGGMGWGGWLAMGFAMVIFWGLVITGIVLLMRSLGRRNDATTLLPRTSLASHILDERFARGEIDADEYARRRELLKTA